MKKLLLVIALFLPLSYFAPIDNTLNAEIVIPPYAKWGRMAMEETKAKYPNAQIIDYLHIGKETNGDTSVEKFKLWLKGEEKEFGVFIDISFNSKTDEVIKITYKETDR
ncbi:hypothetical protein CWR45_14135 [Oceanobacillus chungangensis]|uniref:DUF3889 domain-containing protein n=2 Tax=Oceanobacillus chungangensis TaxID=1229152 RepID=A0A3D8PMJ2_9BACI|nr:YqzG/YhdC family protein [Oceanobacillus chungangensis]RDW16892.1 hypothetical protein CWR45_14135 [Oceanobacillus chungangensis]